MVREVSAVKPVRLQTRKADAAKSEFNSQAPCPPISSLACPCAPPVFMPAQRPAAHRQALQPSQTGRSYLKISRAHAATPHLQRKHKEGAVHADVFQNYNSAVV
jgi:hypothetical protein